MRHNQVDSQKKCCRWVIRLMHGIYDVYVCIINRRDYVCKEILIKYKNT